MTLSRITRRAALKRAAAVTLAAPFTFRAFGAPPSETLLHASIGASGQAAADVRALTASSHLKLVAVADVEDRKSTRLNSSHRCISYAVFCLKKKKKT